MLWCHCSVARSCLTLWAHALRHTIPCPSLSPGVCLNSCPLSQWCYLTISCSAALVFCRQCFPASGSFPVSQLFTSGEDFPVAQMVKCLSTMRETWVRSLGWEGLLEKEMATHFSILAWKIPWMEEPGRLQSMRLQRVGHCWATSLSLLSHQVAKWLEFQHQSFQWILKVYFL